MSKLLERFMQNRLKIFPDENKIIYEHQFGFQKNKSTTLAALDLYSEIKNIRETAICFPCFPGFGKGV